MAQNAAIKGTGAAGFAQSISDWTVATAYAVNQEVLHLGLRFRCTSPHTSHASSFFEDLGNWDCVSTNGFIVNQSSHGLVAKNVIYDNSGTWTTAQADSGSTLSEPVTIVVGANAADTYFLAAQDGTVTFTSHGEGSAGEVLFLSDSVAGDLTSTAPASVSSYQNPIVKILDANTLFVLPFRPSLVSASNYQTMDASYDGTGSGAGRTITVDSGAVQYSTSSSAGILIDGDTGGLSDYKLEIEDTASNSTLAVDNNGAFLISYYTTGAGVTNPLTVYNTTNAANNVAVFRQNYQHTGYDVTGAANIYLQSATNAYESIIRSSSSMVLFTDIDNALTTTPGILVSHENAGADTEAAVKINAETSAGTEDAWVHLNAVSSGGSGEIRFTDGGNSGSTWTQTHMLLSDGSTTTWDAFESKYGEVSIMEALVAAGSGATTTVAASTYTILVTDSVVFVSYTTTGSVVITIPTAVIAVDGFKITINDSGGLAGTNNITVNTGGSETINGQSNLIINGNYDTVTLVSDSSNLFVVN